MSGVSDKSFLFRPYPKLAYGSINISMETTQKQNRFSIKMWPNCLNGKATIYWKHLSGMIFAE